MDTYRNPQWWNKDMDSAWDRVKAAMRRDWDQTKYDFGGNEPDTNQDVDDTVAQAAGRQPIPPRGQPTYEEVEPAYRFGYGAHRYYSDRYTDWDSELENQLREDWRGANPNADDADWDRMSPAIRRGWEYDARTATGQRRM